MEEVIDETDGEVVEDDGVQCSVLEAILLFDELMPPLPLVALADEDWCCCCAADCCCWVWD